jgi:hypothetical protein
MLVLAVTVLMVVPGVVMPMVDLARDSSMLKLGLLLLTLEHFRSALHSALLCHCFAPNVLLGFCLGST